MRKRARRRSVILLALCLTLTLLPLPARAAAAELVFTESGITEKTAGSGYKIEGTALTITQAGSYIVSGSCGEGSITVKKGTKGVSLTLDSLTLACSVTAPLACNKSSGVTLLLNGSSRLTDDEDLADEDDSGDFEGAGVKVKAGASLTVRGDGALTINGNCKNGIKGAGYNSSDDLPGASITVAGGTLVINAANNGLACDNELTVSGGTLIITAGNDGIKAVPDADDAVSAGSILISGGDIAVTAAGDGIQAGGSLRITDGSFNIITGGGYSASRYTGDSSCKGLKASSSDDAAAEMDNALNISGGSFVLNTRDDAIHSDGTVDITGGTFSIYTGDDGVHADTTLTLGSVAGLEFDPYIRILHSYEGLEGGVVNVLGGKYVVRATDDGVNAAGGSDGSSQGDPFRPSGMGGNSAYSLNISGGSLYVNADGDGLDSNGALNLTGGKIEVWSQSSGDNEPLDSDGSLYVQGATVFAAGCAGMGAASPASGSQGYVSLGGSNGGFGPGRPGGFGPGQSSTASIASGRRVTVTGGSGTVFTTTAPKSAGYAFFSSPDTTSAYSISGNSAAASCSADGNCGDELHSWDGGTVTVPATTESDGVRTYTCARCGLTALQTVPRLQEEAGVRGVSVALGGALPSRAVLAWYDAEGRMLAVDAQSVSEGAESVFFPMERPVGAASGKAFFLDEQSRPIQETVWVQNDS